MTFSAIANRYARDIVSGKIPAGGYVVKACARHLADLAASEDPAYPFRWDKKSVEDVCAFAELLPHVKGQWAGRGETLVLQPWQIFLFACLFGWLRKKDGLRRYRHAYLMIPRKNGKSIIAAAVGLYMWGFDGEFGAEVYCGATTEKQAWEVFGPASSMAKRRPDLLESIGGEAWAKRLVIPRDSSKFEAVIGNPGDGSNPSCAIIDEYHEHDSAAMVDTMVTGMGAREHALLLEITTAGFNLASPCYEQEVEARRVLDGVIENEELFAVMYSLDPGDDWTDPANLKKANPNFGVSVGGEFLETQLKQAVQNPFNQNKFKTKHLNIWCSARNPWINLAQWMAAGDSKLCEADLAGSESVISADLASKCDLTAEARVYAKKINGKMHYYLFSRYWLPEDTITEPGKNQGAYMKWAKEGHLLSTDGATIDFEQVAGAIAEDVVRMKPREFVFDPFNAIGLAQEVMKCPNISADFPLVEFIQRPWNFSVAMDEITAALKDGRFHHDGHPVTNWCMANVVAKPGKKDMYSPAKEVNSAKIDGAVAVIMAVSRLMPTELKEETGDIDGWLKANKA